MALLDMMNFAEMAHEIANTAKSKTEKGAVTAGLDAEIAEVGRDFQGFIDQIVENIQKSQTPVDGSVVEENETEKEVVIAGFDAEIAEFGRDLHSFFGQTVKDIQQLDTLVSSSAHFKQDDSVANQAPVEVNYLEMAFALPIVTL